MSYYNEIEQYIKRNEINKTARKLEENNDLLYNYWNIGKLIVEAQGGKSKAKYGNKLLKEWAKEYTKNYGKGYDYSNLSRFRQLYLTFPILGPVAQLSWSTIIKLLPIKDTNKRNYYINLCLRNHLSKRELISEIKNASYERLLLNLNKLKLLLQQKCMKLQLI